VLQQFAARPLWNSSLILPLFLASALHAGLAVLASVGPGRYSQTDQAGQSGQAGSGPYGLGVWFLEVGLVLAQVVFVLAYLFDTGDAVSEAVAFLTRGNPAGYLWSGGIIGWLVPLALFTRSSEHEHTGLRVVRTVCILLGVVCLRAWLVIAGQDASMLVGM
jgi:Ni/Fe-hydrogenase subunit HybB-like protein